MSDAARDAIAAREEAKMPRQHAVYGRVATYTKPEPAEPVEEVRRGRKTVEGNPEGPPPEAEPAAVEVAPEAAEGQGEVGEP